MSAVAPPKPRSAAPNARHSREGGNPASFARYPKYKDSGVEWLGEVPTHWKVERIKASVASCRNGIWGSEESGNDDDIPCVRVADFDRARLVVDQSPPTIRNVSAREREGRLLRSGNLLLEKSGGGEGQPVGCVVLYDCGASAVCSNFVARMELSSDMVPSFWRYVHAAAYAVRLTTRSINQTSGIQNLDQDRYFNERAAFPSVEEQDAIAAFLDRETAKIDALIAEQEKLIALLKEKRQALISHAVTKGLDPNAPMKDSGIEWLGQVPAHWELKPLKHLVTFRSGGTPSKENSDFWNGSVPWASAKDIKVEVLYDTEDHITEYAVTIGAASMVPAGSVVVVVRGMILAKMFPVALLGGSMAINQDLKAILASESIDPGFLAWYLRGTENESLNRLDEAGHGTKALRMDSWASLIVALPPIGEQREIADVVEAQSQTIDALTVEIKRATALLQERRAALISAAVTGKIDVRDKAASNKQDESRAIAGLMGQET